MIIPELLDLASSALRACRFIGQYPLCIPGVFVERSDFRLGFLMAAIKQINDGGQRGRSRNPWPPHQRNKTRTGTRRSALRDGEA